MDKGKKVEVRSSSLQNDSRPVSSVVGRESVRCVTRNQQRGWFIVDLMEMQVQPTHYQLRHYRSWDTEALRSWVFEGSTDGTHWDSLREHKNDQTLNKAGQVGTWEIPDITKSYSKFRILMTDLNSNRQSYLALSGFEVYGRMIRGPSIKPEPQESNIFAVIEASNNNE
eukprot:UN30796